ncbi:MAG: hypothetical protein RR557_06530 [Bacilli bacterium]
MFCSKLLSKQFTLDNNKYPLNKDTLESIMNIEVSIFILVCQLGEITKMMAELKFINQSQFCEWINKDVKYYGYYEEDRNKMITHNI